MKNQYLGLCLVSQPIEHALKSYEKFLTQAIAGGVTSVQLRIKDKNPDELYDVTRQIKTLLDSLDIPLIINDHVLLAKEVDASGVHLGQTDMSPFAARQLLGPEKIIGWSIETLAELQRANQISCIDYVAASAVFQSKTKTDCKTFWGIEGLQQLVQLSKHPLIAIGGIDAENAAAVMATGVEGIAVVSAIHDAENPMLAAKKLRDKVERKND